jgi:hypothetical protein
MKLLFLISVLICAVSSFPNESQMPDAEMLALVYKVKSSIPKSPSPDTTWDATISQYTQPYLVKQAHQTIARNQVESTLQSWNIPENVKNQFRGII